MIDEIEKRDLKEVFGGDTFQFRIKWLPMISRKSMVLLELVGEGSFVVSVWSAQLKPKRN